MAAFPTHHAFTVQTADNVPHAVLDTAATRSMSSIQTLCSLQEALARKNGMDVVSVAPDERTRFTYANGESSLSYGRIGIPHPLGLSVDEDKIWFTAVPTRSPTLLGLDFFQSQGCILDTVNGELMWPVNSNRSSIQCQRLPSGHWGLPLLN